MLATSTLEARPVHPLIPTEYDDATRSARTHELFEQLCTCRGKAARAALIEEITTINLQVADALAQRYSARGLPLDDLIQEARLALVRVVETFKPDLGHDFLSYAVPSILGSLRKQFRDQGWSVRPPRRVQEAQQAINRVRPDLLQDLGREPTVAELRDRTGLDEETVVEALSADGCYAPTSLDAPVVASADASDARTRALGATLGSDDAELARCEIRVALGPLLRRLPQRDREVLRLRFVEGLTQREVGEAIGVTQMQVSRILARIFATLREELGEMPKADLAA